MNEENRKNLLTVLLLILMIALFYPEDMVIPESVRVYDENGENITDEYDEEELTELLMKAGPKEIKVKSRLFEKFRFRIGELVFNEKRSSDID